MNRSEKKLPDTKNLYYIGFALVIGAYFIYTTMLKDLIPGMVTKLATLAGLALMVPNAFRVFRNKRTLITLIVAAGIMGLGIVLGNYIDPVPVIVLAMIAGAYDTDMDTTVKVYFFTALGLLAITVISSQIGIIPNLTYMREDGTLRRSLGAIYPTDFSAHVFFLSAAYLYLRRKNFRYYDFLLVAASLVPLYFLCDARLDCISIVLLLVLTLLYPWLKKGLERSKVLQVLAVCSGLICAGVFLWMTWEYRPENVFLSRINEILNWRLYVGKNSILENGIHLGTNFIEMNGWGGTTTQGADFVYTFVDSSFVRLLLIDGILIYGLILAANVYTIIKALKAKNYYLVVVMVMISINSMVAQHYLDLSYNFPLTLVLANFGNAVLTKDTGPICEGE